MLNSEWYCDICKNGKNYSLTGKWNHLYTKMHKRYELLVLQEKAANAVMNMTEPRRHMENKIILK